MGRLRDFAVGTVELPGTILFGIAKLIFGSTEKRKDGKVKTDREGKPIVFAGLLGLVLEGIGALGRRISSLIDNHKTAISAAFWASLAVGGAVGLTLYLWPAVLTFVADYALFGYSIAGIVGAEPLLQMGFAAGLAFAATSVASWTLSLVANTISAIKNACNPQPEHPEENVQTEQAANESGSSPRMMQRLSTPTTSRPITAMETVPVHISSLHQNVKTEDAEETEELSLSTGLGTN